MFWLARVPITFHLIFVMFVTCIKIWLAVLSIWDTLRVIFLSGMLIWQILNLILLLIVILMQLLVFIIWRNIMSFLMIIQVRKLIVVKLIWFILVIIVGLICLINYLWWILGLLKLWLSYHYMHLIKIRFLHLLKIILDRNCCTSLYQKVYKLVTWVHIYIVNFVLQVLGATVFIQCYNLVLEIILWRRRIYSRNIWGLIRRLLICVFKLRIVVVIFRSRRVIHIVFHIIIFKQNI